MPDPFAFDDSLSGKIVAYLVRLSFWGSEKEIILRWQHETLIASDVECSYKLEDDFDQSLFYLPAAINYLQDASETEIASRAIASFLSCWHKNLNDCSMQEAVTNRFCSLLALWLGKFPSREASKEFRSPDFIIDAFTPLTAINLLNELVEKKVPETDNSNKLLADALLQRIFEAEASAAISANILAFLLKAKTTTSDWKIYRHPIVLDAAFSVDTCKRHALIASDLLKKKTTPAFLNLLEVHLLAAPKTC